MTAANDPRAAARRQRERARARHIYGDRIAEDPCDVIGSPLLLLLRAWSEAHRDRPGAAARRTHFEVALETEDAEDFADALLCMVAADRPAVARFRGAVLDQRARRAAPAGLARHLPPAADQRLAAVLAPGAAGSSPQPIDLILGYHDERGEWQEGIASLTPQEQRAYQLWLDGHDTQAIRLFMSPARATRPKWAGLMLSEKTVEEHLRLARRKLRERFGVPHLVETTPEPVALEVSA